jgi:mRNA interferase MazF
LKRGDIFITDFSPRSGSEQTGIRPSIVISRDNFNKTKSWRSITVLPMTTSENQKSRGPTTIEISASVANGLSRDGAALAHQITTIDKGKLRKKIGSLSEEDLMAVDAALLIALDIHRLP